MSCPRPRWREGTRKRRRRAPRRRRRGNSREDGAHDYALSSVGRVARSEIRELSPKLAARELGAFRQGGELRPRDLWMDAAAQPAIGPGDDVLAADHARVTQDPIRHHLRMLDDVCGMADHAG